MIRSIQPITLAALLAAGSLFTAACGDSDKRPQGPPSIDAPTVKYSAAPADVDAGKALFAQKGCNACHKLGGGKLVGPDLKGVTARRHPLWIARMILKPDVMIKEDETARELFKTHLTPMPNQSVDAATELPKIMAYLKANEN
jgi:mono/diheme cytochrome c family protein